MGHTFSILIEEVVGWLSGHTAFGYQLSRYLGPVISLAIIAAIILIYISTRKAAKARSRLPPIILHACEGNLSQVTDLLDEGTPVDQTDSKGGTALMYAVLNNRLEIAQILVARGANPNARTRDGTSPLDLARKKGLSELEELLARK